MGGASSCVGVWTLFPLIKKDEFSLSFSNF